jgi:fibronectin-binding autotransporter adhesin
MQANFAARWSWCFRTFAAFVFAALTLIFSPITHAQTTVNYTTQTGNFNSLLTERNNNPPYAGTYNNGATELANYANGGSFGNTPGAAAFQTFTTTGNGNTGAVRALQVGDTFTITAWTAANPSAGGYLGISFRDSTTYSNFFSSTDNTTEARFQLDNTGGWKVYNGGTAVDSSLGSNADRTFTIKITSDNTFNATIGANTYYDLSMAAGGGKIDSFSIYTFGDSNSNSFWKTASLTSTGTVELGYAAPGGATRTFSTVISDGLAANSTSTASANAVFIGGDAGSQVNLTAANTYTGGTTVNANARLEIQNASALGGTANGTSVTSGGALSLFQATGGITVANEVLSLNGVGVSGANGALRNTGGDNAWNGTVTLGSNSRINADTSGSSGSLTIGGNISGSTNVLFLGAQGASGGNTGGNISVNGVISGAGAAQDGTTTSVYKDGAGNLTLGGANSYTGDTRIAQGNLTVSGSGNLGNGSDVFIANNASLSVNASATVASVQEWGNTNGGTISLGSGATLTVNGADKGTMYQNSISGAGGLTMSGSGTSSLSLYGTQSYTGTTTVSGGKISSGVALASTNITVSGGTFETSAANIVADTSTVNMSSGTYALGGSDTVRSLNISGGLLSTTNNSAITTTDTTSSSVTVTGGTIGANVAVNSGGGVAFSSGSTTLNGKVSAASGSNLSVGGQVTTGGTDNIGDTTAVNLGATGTLTLGGNETTGSFTSFGGSLLGTGNKLQATGYDLRGGTISANLGSGNLSVNQAGSSTTLNGTADSTTVTIWNGTLLLGAAERLNNSANVAVNNSGTLNVQGFNEAVNSLTVSNSATVSGTGTLTASTYTLNGGTVNANLGTGTLTSSTNSTTLNGTAAATTVNVSGGLLALGAANRLADTAAVAVSNSGTLNLNGNDTVGSLSTASGTTVGGSGTLTASTYTLNGGTVNANLGTGTLTSSTGTTTLNGTAAATAVNVNGGTLNTGGADKLANNAGLAVTSGILGVGGNDTVGSVALSSSGTVSVAAGSTLTATADSTISGTAKATGGTVAISNGAKLTLANNANTTTSDISVGNSSSLVGTGGTTGKISGSGLLGPGNSPGILTASQVDVSAGLDFAFEFTGTGAPTYSSATASRNDLLHLTSGSSPFVGSFSSANSISFFFNDASLSASLLAINPATYLGGFYVDSLSFDIASLLSAATKSYYIVDANGSFGYNGVQYSLLSSDVASRVIFDNANQTSSAFDTGTTSGTVLSVTMVPEPSSASLLTFALSGLLALRRRKA